MDQASRKEQFMSYHVPPSAAQTPEEMKYAVLFRDYIRDLLGELGRRYAAGDVFDVVAQEVPDIDFHDKTPVWIIWWQGEESAPEIVKLCLASIRRHLPENLADIRLITGENYASYVSLPARIVQFVNNGTITLTHLTDLLRAQLLTKYGGFYMDATYLVRDRMPDAWFAEDAFYMPRLPEPEPRFVSRGQWFANFWKAQKSDLLARYLMNAFYLYWSEQEILADYFLIDIIIAEAVRSVPAIAERIIGNPPSQPHIEHLVHNLNSPYDEAVDRILREDTFVYKLTWKLPFEKETADGRETLYGHICREMI